MSILVLREARKARRIVARLESKMPRELAKLVGGYLSPVPGDEFKVQIQASTRKNSLGESIYPVRDHLGKNFYLRCEADVDFWVHRQPTGRPKWISSETLLGTNLDSNSTATLDRIGECLKEQVEVLFPGKTLRKSWCESGPEPELPLLTLELIKPGRYRLALQLKSLREGRRY